MKIKTKFFGEIEVPAEEIIHFPSGLPGFESEKEFVHLQPEDSVFGCLQSCHQPATAFIVLSPYQLCPDYEFELDEEKREALAVAKSEEVKVLSIVTIPPGKPEEATVNLYAPIVINTTAKKGMQVILSESGYPLRFKLWAPKGSSSTAAAK